MSSKKSAVYKPRSLVSGSVIGKEGDYVAVPDKGYKKEKNFYVQFGGKTMMIPSWHKAEAFRRFHDMYGGADYLLGYFSWKPIDDQYEFIGNTAVKI